MMTSGILYRKQYQFIALVATCMIILVVTLSHLDLPNRESVLCNNSSYKQVAIHLPTSVSDVIVPTEPEYELDYTPEDIALKLPACADRKLAADPTNSKIYIQESEKRIFHLGERINVSIKLYDGYGTPLDKGGSILRARMFNQTKAAFATALITDHGDGSYTAQFEALWTGMSIIKVALAYTPETIRALYYVRRKLPSTVHIEATFSVGQITESTFCSPSFDDVRYWNYSQICNLTGDNSGMPWYCGKPSNVHLLCEDWTGVKKTFPYPEMPYTPCENILIKRGGKEINQKLTVYVARETTTGVATISPPTNLCRDLNVTSLWTRRQPTGFMFWNRWHLRHCRPNKPADRFACLKHRKVLLFGDSTVRDWYSFIVLNWKCAPTTEKWTQDKWHKRTACANTQYNFTVQWLPHSQPFFFFSDVNRYTRTSIARHLDETGKNERVVALVHLYLHISVFHHSHFRHKIRKIRASVESLISRNKFAKVFIKGPHTVAGTFSASDYFSLVYRHILFEEFKGLHDKVIYLDNSDISTAMPITDIHPPFNVVANMIDQMLAYLC